ncbi:histidine kinase [Paenibacillus yanchengensis]|uniref:Histidine kinase n=1 Tax=Paenibacillus yanchengensis TaxID=2035833 RepID=A0ABW4YHJ7_9BACL
MSLNQLLFGPIRYIKQSLYRKIVASFFIIIALTVAVLIWNFHTQTADNMKKQAVFNLERLAEQAESTLSSHMSSVKRFAWDYFGDSNFQRFVKQMGTDPEIYSYYLSKLNQFVTEQEMIEKITVSQLSGNRLIAGYQRETSHSIAEEERLKEIALAHDGKGVWVVSDTEGNNTFASNGEKQPTLVFVQALKEVKMTERPLIGVMLIQFKGEAIQQWLRGIEGTVQGNFHLLDKSDNKIIVPSSFEHDMSSSQLPVVFLASTDIEKINTTMGYGHFFSNEQQDNQLIVFRHLKNTEWTLVGKVSMKVLLTPVYDVARQAIWLGIIVCLVAVLVASLLYSKISTPLKRLTRSMKLIETGNYDVVVPVESEDEIGYICIGFNAMSQEINRLIVKVYEADLLKKDAEIKALQSQINPHFLYNTLGTIDSLATLHDDERISRISQALAQMCRYNLNGERIATLGDELQQIDKYLTIQKIRFGNRLTYDIDVDDILNNVLVPKLLVQPIVENSILHGIDRVVLGGQVNIRMYKDKQDVIVEVYNNGPIIPKEKCEEIQNVLNDVVKLPSKLEKTENLSIGLLNVHLRLKLIYGSAYGVSFVSSEQQGTIFTIKFHEKLTEEALHDETVNR